MRCAELNTWIASGSYKELITKHNKPILQQTKFCPNPRSGRPVKNDVISVFFADSKLMQKHNLNVDLTSVEKEQKVKH